MLFPQQTSLGHVHLLLCHLSGWHFVLWFWTTVGELACAGGDIGARLLFIIQHNPKGEGEEMSTLRPCPRTPC